MSQEEYIQDDVTIAHVALGTNKSDKGSTPKDILTTAIARISDQVGKVLAVSDYYSTPCFPAGHGPDYVNATLTLQVIRSARETLDMLHSVEIGLGRTRDKRWESRVIDLDLLSFGDAVAPNLSFYNEWFDMPLERQMVEAPSELVLPHPRLHERAFVLVPLADIAPDWRHPVLGKTVVEMRDALPAADIEAVRAL